MYSIEIQDIKQKIEEVPLMRTIRMRFEKSIITIFKLSNSNYSINSNKIDIEKNYNYSDMIVFLENELMNNKCIYISIDKKSRS